MTTSWVYWPYSAAWCNLCIVAPHNDSQGHHEILTLTVPLREVWRSSGWFNLCVLAYFRLNMSIIGCKNLEQSLHDISIYLYDFGEDTKWPIKYLDTSTLLLLGLQFFLCHWFGWFVHKCMVFFYGKLSCPARGASWWTPFLAQVCSGMTPMDISQCGLDETSKHI